VLRAQAGELARLGVVLAVFLEVALLPLVFGRPGLAARLGQAGAAEHDDGRADAALGEDHLRLQELELQADRAQLAPGHEVGVVPGQPVGRGAGLRRVGRLPGALEVLVGMRQRAPARLLHRIHPVPVRPAAPSRVAAAIDPPSAFA